MQIEYEYFTYGSIMYYLLKDFSRHLYLIWVFPFHVNVYLSCGFHRAATLQTYDCLTKYEQVVG